ncbi:MAG: ion transporter [Verrucomicrobiota bacterium JB022]|nr:ion transporter [Verrucomicrobiota bacterium JB022]
MDRSPQSLRERTRIIIFESDTPAGKAFDVLLIFSILASVAAVMAVSVEPWRAQYGPVLRAAEWAFTVLFTVEYLLRLWSAPSARRYQRSFFGVVDLLSILPTYLSLLLPGAEYILMLRLLRTLRIFRVLKLLAYIQGSNVILTALRASRYKITVFILTVAVLVTLMGSLMYIVEGGQNGFTSIPTSIYWAIVTLTTVGYGDISPQTPLGQFLASAIMLTGYAIIAVPTGIVTAELARAPREELTRPGRRCPRCGSPDQRPSARYCDQCGEDL